MYTVPMVIKRRILLKNVIQLYSAISLTRMCFSFFSIKKCFLKLPPVEMATRILLRNKNNQKKTLLKEVLQPKTLSRKVFLETII